MYRTPSFYLLLAFGNFWIIDAFSTDDCDHDKLSNETQKAITCLDVVVSKSVDEIVDDYKAQLKSNNSIYKVSKGCSLLKMFSQDAEDCVMKLDASCFGHSYRQVIKAYSNYPVFFCDQLQFQNGSDIADVDQQKKFVIPKIDKECQPNDFRTEFDKVLSEIHGEFSRMVEPLVDYFENKQFLQEQTFCVPLNNFLETTMVENICISQREMDLMKHLVRAGYRTPMKAAIKIKGKFGDAKGVVEVLEKTQVEIGMNDSLVKGKPQNTFALGEYMASVAVSQVAEKIVKISDQIIDDFEAKECQGLINTGFKIRNFPFLLFFLSSLALFLVY